MTLFAPETSIFSPGASVMPWTLKCRGSLVTVGSLVAATTFRTAAAGGGAFCAAAGTAKTVVVNIIAIAVSRMMLLPRWNTLYSIAYSENCKRPMFDEQTAGMGLVTF